MSPTRSSEVRIVSPSDWATRLAEPIRLTKETVVIDARTSFDYSMAHVIGSLNISWTEFAEGKGYAPGRLKVDYQAMSERLARLGVGPDTPVVVLGYGQNGRGEEGRLAWTLYALGLNDIQIADVSLFTEQFSNAETLPRPNLPTWKARFRSSLEADRMELIRAAVAKLDADRPKTFIIDVRSKSEFFATKNGAYRTPDLRALNIEWREFYTETGRPNLSMREKLGAIGIRTTDRIILISQQGLRSGAGAAALLSLGYTNVANYSGGYLELLRQPTGY